MTGWKFLDTIKEMKQKNQIAELPTIIVITAYDDAANRLVGKLQGIHSYLIKPFTPDHGTTQVFVFYKRAIDRAGSEDAVDISDFTYPGPIPQSKETAILMMADSCESAIRAIKPQSNKEITDVVHRIIESKRNDGQLDGCNLTLNELRKIEETFIDIFKGLFHPRINYEKAVQPRQQTSRDTASSKQATQPKKSTHAHCWIASQSR